MNSIILACLALAGAVAVADAIPGGKKSRKCVDREFPMCALAYKKQLTNPQPSPPKRQFDCAKCQAEATAVQLTDPDTWIPVCNKDDSFKKEQYDPGMNESFCVDPYGEEIPRSRKKGKKIICRIKTKLIAPKPKLSDCQKMKFKAKKLKSIYVPTCNKAGQFSHTQCYGKSKFCWCAMETGKPVPYTFFKKGGKRKQPNCLQHRGTKLDCKGKEGVRQHPFDCKRYLQCGKDTVYSCICPWNQAFNFSLKVCDWVENIKGCPAGGKLKKHYGYGYGGQAGSAGYAMHGKYGR